VSGGPKAGFFNEYLSEMARIYRIWRRFSWISEKLLCVEWEYEVEIGWNSVWRRLVEIGWDSFSL